MFRNGRRVLATVLIVVGWFMLAHPPVRAAELETTGDVQSSSIVSTYSGTMGAGSILNLRRARGTGASPSNVSSSDDLGSIEFLGYNSGWNAAAAKIRAVSGGGAAGRLEFYTNNSSLLKEAMHISSSGWVGINTPLPQGRLHVTSVTGGQGTAAANADEIVAENDANAGITILTPTGTEELSYIASLHFGNGSDSDPGRIVYDTYNHFMQFYTNNSTRMAIYSDGKVGIGTTSPAEKLHVAGNIRTDNALILKEQGSDPSGTADYLTLFAKQDGATDAALFARYGAAASTRISSHKDPRDLDPQAHASFADPAVALPWSFHHYSNLLGKGAVVDMAKLVGYVESRMKLELGAEDGRLVYNYDLPTSETVALAQYNQSIADRRIKEDLAENPWVEVALRPTGEIPDEAFAVIEITEPVTTTRVITETVIDYETRRVVTREREVQVQEYAGTGRYETHLKANHEFRDGKVYRRRTADDVDPALIAAKMPALPRWILDRVGR